MAGRKEKMSTSDNSKRDETSVRSRSRISRRPRREPVDDRATGRKPAPAPEVDPNAVPTSPQEPYPGDDRAKPPSPYPSRMER